MERSVARVRECLTQNCPPKCMAFLAGAFYGSGYIGNCYIQYPSKSKNRGGDCLPGE